MLALGAGFAAGVSSAYLGTSCVVAAGLLLAVISLPLVRG